MHGYAPFAFPMRSFASLWNADERFAFPMRSFAPLWNGKEHFAFRMRRFVSLWNAKECEVFHRAFFQTLCDTFSPKLSHTAFLQTLCDTFSPRVSHTAFSHSLCDTFCLCLFTVEALQPQRDQKNMRQTRTFRAVAHFKLNIYSTILKIFYVLNDQLLQGCGFSKGWQNIHYLIFANFT